MDTASCVLPCADVERRKNPVCGFITPLEGMEADEHRKPEVGQGPLQLSGAAAGLCGTLGIWGHVAFHRFAGKGVSDMVQGKQPWLWGDGAGELSHDPLSCPPGCRAGGKLLETPHRGGDEGVPQVEDLL